MQRIILVLFVTSMLVLNAGGQSKNPATVGDVKAPATAAMIEILSVPPRLVQRFEPLHAALNPSARAWVEQQARIEARRPKPDLNALRAAIRQRFPRSFASQAPGVSVAGKNRDVDAVAFLVLTESAQQTQAQQTYQLQQMQEFNTVSQVLRQTLNQLTQQHQPAKGNADDDKPCQTAFCTSLPSRLESLNRASATLPHPLHLQAPANLTVVQFNSLINQMESKLDSVGDDAQLANVDLQNTLQHQQQALQMLSDIEKSDYDTSMAIIKNLK